LPVALQAFLDGFLAGPDARIAQASQLLWITFPAHDGSDDREPGRTADITNDVMQVNIRQRQSFLHSKLLLSRSLNDLAA
jgi:hypothetical protein